VDFEVERSGSIFGQVSDKETGEPLEGIWVSVYDQTRNIFGVAKYKDAITDSDGKFQFESLRPMTYAVGARRTGDYIPAMWKNNKEITVSSGEVVKDIVIQLERGSQVEVTVSSESGEKITGATLSLSDKQRGVASFGFPNISNNLLPKVEEDGDGRYIIRGLKPGAFSVSASRNGWIKDFKAFSIDAEAPTSAIEMVLSPSFTVLGNVKDPGGSGVPGACVVIGYESSRKNIDITGNDGSFSITDRSPGKNNVKVNAEGYAEYRSRFQVQKDKNLDFTIIHEGAHFIAGTVKDDKGKALSNITIDGSQRIDNNRINMTTKSKDNGAFRLDGLLEGDVRLSVKAEMGELKMDKTTFPVDQSGVELLIERYARIKGELRDHSGKKISSFKVSTKNSSKRNEFDSIFQGSSGQNQSFTGGVFDLKKVKPGDVVITATTSDGRKGKSKLISIKPGETRENVVVNLIKLGAISGRVVDGATSKPIPGVKINASHNKNNQSSIFFGYPRKADATTSKDGSFTVNNLDSGKINLEAVHPDYCTGKLNDINVVENQITKGVDILLVHGGTISGVVYAGGLVKPGVRVSARRNSENIGFFMQNYGLNSHFTKKDGSYELKNLPAGEYAVTASIKNADNSSTIDRTVIIKNIECATCDFVFGEASSISGVVYINGKPSPNVNINAYMSDTINDLLKSSTGSSTAKTAKDGSYLVENLSPGKYRLSARSYFDGNSFKSKKEINVGVGVNVCDFYLGEGDNCSLRGFIYKDGAGVPNYKVRCNGEGVNMRQSTDNNGFFEFRDLPSGKATLSINLNSGSMFDNSSFSKTLTLADGESAQHDFNLSEGKGVIFGDVVVNDSPASGSYISMSSAKGDNQYVFMSNYVVNGKYRFENIPPGDYNLTLSGKRQAHRSVEIKGVEEIRVDFDLKTGTAVIEGVLEIPEKKNNKSISRFSVYLFKPGGCPWSTGFFINKPMHEIGVIADSRNIKASGNFTIKHLFPEPVDIVAVELAGAKIIKLAKKSVTLTEGKKSQVTLSLK